MKKLLYVAPFFSIPPTTGADLRAIHLAEQLSSRWKVTVLVRKAGSGSELDCWAKERGIQIEWLDCSWNQPVTGELARMFAARPPGFSALDPACIAGCIKAVESSQGAFDLVLLATQLAGQVLLTRKWQTPVVLDLYDLYTPLAYQRLMETQISRPYHWIYWWELLRIAGRERRIIKRSRLCLLPSREELQAAQEMFPSADLVMLPNGVALPEEQHTFSAGPQVLLVGSLHHGPNLEGFHWFHEQAWPQVLAANPQARLCLVGSGQELLSTDKRKDASLILAGQVPDVAPYYQSSRCAIVPVLHGGGTRLKLLEAMAWGIPVVSTPAGCAGVEHQNSILVADDAVTFAQRVLEVLADPFCFAGQAGRARHVIADYYTWDRIGRKLLGHLDALIKAG